MTTVFVLIALVAVPGAWEVYALLGDPITISRAYMHMAEATPFVSYALSALVGHFFVQPPAEYTVAHYLSEPGEVAIVLWLGWGVFVMGKAGVSLPWWGSLALVIGSVLVGAFAWTIGV